MMSSANQNGKKCGSGGNSVVNTPASTPVTSCPNINGDSATQPVLPTNNNAPKYGTLVPNRIFVGGISASTTESELMQLFSTYGVVKAVKIIMDRAGVSKGYGFITFENEEVAKRLQRDTDSILFKERKLNIAPAVKKQPFGRTFDASSPPTVAAANPGPYYFQPGVIPYFQSTTGMTYFQPTVTTSGDLNTQQPPMYQAPTVYPTQSGPAQTPTYPQVMIPQPLYMPQQYPMPMPCDYNYYAASGSAQYVMGAQGGPPAPPPPPQMYPMQQRPGSPPRPPSCFNHQMPTCNPDFMYYPPLYAPVDGSALYGESLDLATNSFAAEDSGFKQHNSTIQHQLVADRQEVSDNSQQHHKYLTSSNSNAKQPAIKAQNDMKCKNFIGGGPRVVNDNTATANVDMSRQSKTPVVSALSAHQVRDPVSMQSGRRPRYTNNANNVDYMRRNDIARKYGEEYKMDNPHKYNDFGNKSNGNIYHGENNSYRFDNMTSPALLAEENYRSSSRYYNGHREYNHCNRRNQSGLQFCNNNNNGSNCQNRQQTWSRRWQQSDNRRTSHDVSSSASSLRTESNSSSSAVTEENNTKVEQLFTADNNVRPPVAHSPMLQSCNGSVENHNGVARNYHSLKTARGSSHVENKPARNFHVNYRKTYSNQNASRKKQQSNELGHSNNNNSSSADISSAKLTSSVHATDSNQTDLKAAAGNVLQVNQQYTANLQHFVPPSRRNGKRSVRRVSQQQLSEIGAGDAPLPTGERDVADACRKLDAVKL